MNRLKTSLSIVLGILSAAGCAPQQHVSMGAEAGGPGAGGLPTSNGGTNAGGSTLGGTSSTLPVPVGPWTSIAAPVDKASAVQAIAALDGMTTTDLNQRSSEVLSSSLGYAPADAKWLDLIQSSSLALNDRELAVYHDKGFVISDRQSYPNFFYGYKTIYSSDLPIYVTADSILYALHRSYDAILMQIERAYLSGTLQTLLSGLQSQIAAASISANAKQDLSLLLGVAATLLSGTPSTNSDIQALVNLATAASGTQTVSLFGEDRDVDFSQFKPRGHYAGDTALERYFRAMMWLGRTELRLVDVDESGERTLKRRQVEDILALDASCTESLRAQWSSIDQIVGLFVGEPDYMTLDQAAKLKTDLGGAADLSTVSDQKMLDTIMAGNYGNQRILSQLMLVNKGVTALPSSFAFLGQRYTVDSHVFSKVVYPNSELMMPNPLDAAFAAFGNNQAAPLLQPQLETFGYAPALGKARQLIEWHDASYWDSSLYTLWVSSLRQLSSGKYDPAKLPAVARTEAWGRRLLNTQLGSWAELRHDTLLYAKQSYTGIPLCEYPDGYVDPYPALFARLKLLGSFAVQKLTPVLPAGSAAIITYFQKFADVAGRLESMANEELTGAPRSQAELDFLNDAVVTKTQSAGCASITVPSGWYSALFYNQDNAMTADPTIADVHTQPAERDGTPVGKVLHVATGNPRLMIVSVDSCEGPRAYAGVVSAYFEQTTKDFQRKTDDEWSTELNAATPADVPWMQDLIVR